MVAYSVGWCHAGNAGLQLIQLKHGQATAASAPCVKQMQAAAEAEAGHAQESVRSDRLAFRTQVCGAGCKVTVKGQGCATSASAGTVWDNERFGESSEIRRQQEPAGRMREKNQGAEVSMCCFQQEAEREMQMRRGGGGTKRDDNGWGA